MKKDSSFYRIQAKNHKAWRKEWQAIGLMNDPATKFDPPFLTTPDGAVYEVRKDGWRRRKDKEDYRRS